MSDKVPTTQNEEVDLGKLFQIIGKGFSNLLNAIGNLLKYIFHFLINILIFLKKNAIIIGTTTVLGGVLGYVTSIDNEPIYQSDMIMSINFGSGHQLYSQNNYLNVLIEKEYTKELAKIFNITKEEASTLHRFSVEPNEPQKNILIEFDYHMQNTDTVFTRGLTVEEFAKRLNLLDYKIQKVTAYGTNPIIFSKLNTGIINLVENDYLKQILNLKQKEFAFRDKTLRKELNEIDSLRARYKKVAILNAKNTKTTGTNISLTEKTSAINKDLDLFVQKNRILEDLRKIDNERINKEFITTIISEFHLGSQQTSVQGKKWFKFAVLGFLLSLFVILGFKLNKYLTNYQK